MTDIVEIGKGAFATVYNAYDRALGFRVALKVVSIIIVIIIKHF